MAKENLFYGGNRLRVCLDSLDPEGICGRVFTIFRENPIIFYDISDFLVQVDEIFDEEGYPQSFQDKRSFAEPKGRSVFNAMPAQRKSGEAIVSQHGKIATYDVLVKSRQNTTWQGEVQDTEGKILEQFYEAIRLGDIFEKYL